MQFLAINERNTTDFDPEAIAERVPHEVQRVRELYAQSFVRQIWHRGDLPGGVLLIEAASEEAAREQLATLPMVGAGMVRVAHVIPLEPFAGFGATAH